MSVTEMAERSATLIDPKSFYDLSGQVAVVTGGGAGMGKEICAHLASVGVTVVAADINLSAAEKTATEINESGGKAVAMAVDLADESSIVALVAQVRSDFPQIDILVNVAGLQTRELLGDTSGELWDRIHNINEKGTFLCLREVSNVMKADQTAGRIVNISSMGSVHPVSAGLAAYGASKAGVNGLTKNAAYELAEHGITVNAVLPGTIPTPGSIKAGDGGPEISPQTMARIVSPLGRLGTPEDIAAAVLFFVSPGASFVTGQLLVVDGGFLLS